MALTGDEQSLKITIEAALSNTAMVSMAVRGVCNLVPLTPVEIDRVELCLIEVLNNVIVHAYQQQPDHFVETEVVLSRSIISLIVSDWGRRMPEDVCTVLQMAGEAKASPELHVSGRGLMIVRSLMDTASYSSDSGKNSFFMAMHMIRSSGELI